MSNFLKVSFSRIIRHQKWVTGHFETIAPNDPKWPLTLKGQSYPFYGLLLPRVPNFTLCALHPAIFRLQATGYKYIERLSKMTLNTKRPKVYLLHKQPPPPQLLNFNGFCSTARVTVYFETSAPTGRKITLNNKRSKLPYMYIHMTTTLSSKFHWTLNTKRSKKSHIHITTTPPPFPPESQILNRFAIRAGVVVLQAIMRKVHWMTSK